MPLRNRLRRLTTLAARVWEADYPGHCRRCGRLHQVPFLLRVGRGEEAGTPCRCACCPHMVALVRWGGHEAAGTGLAAPR